MDFPIFLIWQIFGVALSTVLGGIFWQNNKQFSVFTSLGNLGAYIMYTYLPNLRNTGMIDLQKVINLVWQLFF